MSSSSPAPTEGSAHTSWNRPWIAAPALSTPLRGPHGRDDPRVIPLTLDVTDPASVAAAAAAASDVTLVINNAGGANGATVLEDSPALRALFEERLLRPTRRRQGLCPALAANGGGALLNVLSVLSGVGVGDGYSATKAALWSATNTQRLTLANRALS